MQLSLRLSFHLKHNLEGYTVGTTIGFQVEIVACDHLFRHPLKGHFFVTHSNGRYEGYCQVNYPSTARHRLRPIGTDMTDSL
jgi:hypothetical protein